MLSETMINLHSKKDNKPESVSLSFYQEDKENLQIIADILNKKSKRHISNSAANRIAISFFKSQLESEDKQLIKKLPELLFENS